MAEMMAFSRRHHSPHGAADSPRAPAGSGAPYSSTAHANNDVVITTGTSYSQIQHQQTKKNRTHRNKDRARATTGSFDDADGNSHSHRRKTNTKKMSGTQLRVFFVVCVALYLSTLYFADEIVAFARWMSGDTSTTNRANAWDHEPTAAKEAAEPEATDERRHAASELLVKATVAPLTPTNTISQEEEVKKKTGNLRGADDGVGVVVDHPLVSRVGANNMTKETNQPLPRTAQHPQGEEDGTKILETPELLKPPVIDLVTASSSLAGDAIMVATATTMSQDLAGAGASAAAIQVLDGEATAAKEAGALQEQVDATRNAAAEGSQQV